jgi:hypothetical protein
MDGKEEQGGLFSWLPDATEGEWGALHRVLLLKKRVRDEEVERQEQWDEMSVNVKSSGKLQQQLRVQDP